MSFGIVCLKDRVIIARNLNSRTTARNIISNEYVGYTQSLIPFEYNTKTKEVTRVFSEKESIVNKAKNIISSNNL